MENNINIISVQQLQIECNEYMELIQEKIYFISNNKLYFTSEKNCTSKTECIQNYGKVESIFPFCNCIFAVIAGASKTGLYKFDGTTFTEIVSDFYGKTKQYFITDDGEHVIFFEYPSREDEKTRFYILNRDFSIKRYIADHNCHHFHNLTIFENKLYIAAGDTPHTILYADFNSILSKDNDATIEFTTLKNIPVYNFIHNKGELLTADDGMTIIRHMDNRIYFQDTAIQKSGFQIAANSSQELDTKYLLLGTWRRSDEHPYSCFYILKNGKQIVKYIDHIHVKTAKPWTGYTYNNSSTNQPSKIIFSNLYGMPLLIKTYKSYNDFYSEMKNTEMIIKYVDKNLIVVFDKNMSENLNSTDTKEPVPAKKHFFYDNTRACNVFITIDVEQHLKNIPFCITGEGLTPKCGIYFIMDTLEKYGLKGVFFVNIYEHKNFDNTIETIVSDIHKRGHEVGLHWHKSNLKFNNKAQNYYNYDEQKYILEYGKNFIEKIINDKLYSYRSGAYELSEKTLKALSDIGIPVDSSVFMGRPNPIHHKTKNNICRYGNLIEVPVTTHALDGFLSKIDINWNRSAQAMLEKMQACRQSGIKNIVVMAHSFSFIAFTKNQKEAIGNLAFTSGRFAKGVNTKLMHEFEKFCNEISKIRYYNVTTFKEAYQQGLLQEDHSKATDIIPFQKVTDSMDGYCPICGNSVQFSPYRERENALCPKCSSLERMRLKMLYLKGILNIENCGYKSILHIGPAECVRKVLRQQTHLDYISADPFSPADMNFKIENIPFAENIFDLIICSAVMMHVLDDDKGFSEMYRILKPKGELLLWLGNCASETTQEHYDRNLYHKMVADDISTPKDLHAPVTREKDGIIYYNPRYATRIYGKDVFKKLEGFGFSVKIIPATAFANHKLCGISSEDLLISCIKN